MDSYNFYQYPTKYGGHLIEATLAYLPELKQCKSCQKTILEDNKFIFIDCLDKKIIWLNAQENNLDVCILKIILFMKYRI